MTNPKGMYYKTFRLLAIQFFLFIGVMAYSGMASAQSGAIRSSVFSKIDGLSSGAIAEAVYMPDNEMTVYLQNIVSLRLKEETSAYIPENFSASVKLTILYGADAASALSHDETFTITYNKDPGAKYNPIKYLAFSGARYVKVIVGDITVPNLSNNVDIKTLLRVENEIRYSRYYELIDESNGGSLRPATLSSEFTNTTGVPDAVRIKWTWQTGTGVPNMGNNGIQLEWTWLPDELASQYTKADGKIDDALLFRNNSTRIDLSNSAYQYDIPLFYDGTGKLYYRIRVINQKSSGSRSDGPWSEAQFVSFAGHNDNLNWQATTSYAEEGKRKSVITYFDGSLRQRQTITKDNSTNTTVSAETFYDGQGRAAVQILPAPGINNIVAYNWDLNRFNTQAPGSDPASFFDLQSAPGTGTSTPPLSTDVGTARYYSPSNPETADGSNKYLPDAQGYPYSVTRYTPDGTGRVASQSGVGAAFRMGSGHETKYYYGQPSQAELDGLFGTEAGIASHYFKNMVQDPNGQMSVSYVDMHGRTIATALAGEAPSNMVKLNLSQDQYPGQSGTGITQNLLNPKTNLVKGNAIESFTTLMPSAKTEYAFQYTLSPDVVKLPQCNSTAQICLDCLYDLEISITDESGDNEPIVRHFSNLSAGITNDCAGGPFLDKIQGESAISTITGNSIAFTETLAPGSYTIRKTLTMSESSLQTLRDQYLQVGLCQTEQEMADDIYNNVLKPGSACDVPQDESSCPDCLGNSTPTRLQAIRQLMISDMFPYSGQYAKQLPNSPSDIYKKYNIFWAGSTGQPFYRFPLTADKKTGFYNDINGNHDQALYPDANGPSLLSQLSPDDFTNLFSPSWADALLPYHPEYDRLVFAENTLSPHYIWMDRVNKITSYADAQSSTIGISLPSDGKLEDVDPFFQLATDQKDNMKNLVIGKYYGGMSMWQMAYGNAVYKTTTDLQTRDEQYAAAPKQPPFTGLTTTQLDQVWNSFRSLYANARDSMMTAYMVAKVPLADASALANPPYQLRFPENTAQMASQYDWKGVPAVAGDAPTVDLGTQAAAVPESRCSSYIEQWNRALSQCPAIASLPDADKKAILAEITAGMVAVCQKGQDESNPYGASSVAPSTPVDNSPRDFEKVVQDVFGNHHIDKSQYCNPFVVEFPKPYGKGPIFTKAVIGIVDRCTCDQFDKIKAEALGSGADPTNLNSLNTYLNNTYHDVLTQELFDGLQRCSVIGTQTCRFKIDTTKGPCSQIGIPDCTVKGSSNIAGVANLGGQPPDTTKHPYPDDPGDGGGSGGSGGSGGGTTVDSCIVITAHPVCEVVQNYLLASPQPKPTFLNCGFVGQSCVTCAALSSLITDYKAYYSGMLCAEAPILSTDPLTDEQVGYNITFQQFVNYRTGLQLDWMAYMKAAAAIGCDLSKPAENANNIGVIACPDPQPLNDPTTVVVQQTPCQRLYDKALEQAARQYSQKKAQLLADFDAAYRGKCLDVKNNESFSVQYTPKEYHYTLYYYDMAGNLVKTVPPKGVNPDFSADFVSRVETARPLGMQVTPDHNFLTEYKYNSLNQVVTQKTPDAGQSNFWYDALGRLAVSQNAQQALEKKFSYSIYDPLGRITEVGQKPQATTMSQSLSQDPTQLFNWVYNSGDPREQTTNTVYDLSAKDISNGVFDPSPNITQNNLRNRVSFTYTRKSAASGNEFTNLYTASYYTYDIHGNVDTLLQDYAGIPAMAVPNRYKRICYDYDLISGKVNGVDYQPGKYDAFYHRYSYDAENRLLEVKTSRDSIIWERDAAYRYYKHGPLASMVLGKLQPQELDYSYTLQGWLKGVNIGKDDGMSQTCEPGTGVDNLLVNKTSSGSTLFLARSLIEFVDEFDSGDQGTLDAQVDNSLGECVLTTSSPGSGSSQSSPVGQDAFNYSLNYYPGDYLPVGPNVATASILGSIGSQAAPLYNGNIAALAVNIPSVGDPKVYNYHYDQLHRLVQMEAFKGLNSTLTTFTPVQIDDYKERVTYDPNGNILGYFRNGYEDGTHHTPMDKLRYQYIDNSNKLDHLEDTVTASGYGTDLETQGAGNYRYDAIGNLVADNAEKIESIKWSVYGKILEIQKSANGTNPNTNIQYTYGPSGNRVSKLVNNTNSTIYVRDAQGNVLGVYQSTPNGLQQIEAHLYGGSRLGIIGVLTNAPTAVNLGTAFGNSMLGTLTRGEKSYELTNHLGNVLAAISDRKNAIPSSPGSSLIDHFTADISSAQDYYPFGMQMPGRSFVRVGSYRYGFNGKENDNEVKGIGDQIDYGMRVYDPRVGKFLSVDPLTHSYPMLTPYQFSSNCPIAAIDIDGAESSIVTVKWSSDNKGTVLSTVTSDIYVQPQGVWSYKKKETLKEEVAKDFIELMKLPSNGYFQYIEFQHDPDKNYAVYLYFDESGTSKELLVPHEIVKEWLDYYINLHKEAAKFWEVSGHVGDLIAAGSAGKSEFKALTTDLAAEEKALASEASVESSANRGMGSALEKVSQRDPIAQAYEDGATGAASDIATRKRVVPTLRYDNPNPRGRNEVKFDGYDLENKTLIDRKWNVTTFQKSLDQLKRMSSALQQNPEYQGVIEVPDAKAFDNATRAVRKAGVSNITVIIKQK